MKTFGLIVMTGLFSFMMLTGCEKDETTISGNPDLEVIPASALMGTYHVTDACYEQGTAAYTMMLNPVSGEDDRLVIYNFMNRGIIVSAYHSNGRFIIPSQTFPNSTVNARSDESFSIRGEMFYTAEKELFLTYEFDFGGHLSHCSAECTPSDQ